MTGDVETDARVALGHDADLIREIELARRWHVSRRTLQRWRQLATGPRWLQIGRRILYRIEDIERFERSRLRSDACPPTPLT